MALNVARGATAGILGAVSGALEEQTPTMIGTTAVRYSTMVEALGLVAGLGLQLASPFTMPQMADGLADGGLALLLRRGAQFARRQMAPVTTTSAHYAERVSGWASPQGVRGDVGSFTGGRKYVLT